MYSAADEDWEAVENHVVDSMKSALIFEQPFIHISARHIFPAETYAKMLEMLPETSYYEDLRHPDALREDGTSTRVHMPLTPATLGRLPEPHREFWRSVNEVLMSKRLQTAIFELVAPDLIERFNCPIDQIDAHPKPTLTRDTAGYRIRPHPDTSSKVVTVLLYLPKNASQTTAGTTIYERTDNPENEFVEVRSMPFLPNSGLIFAVSKNSWHGRETLPAQIEQRDTISLTYFRELDGRD